MTPPLYLMLVFHNHQPVGQFDYVIEHSVNVSYLPLIELLEQYPAVKVGMHYSGPLLEWLKQHHRSILERLQRLVNRNQVEMLSGGYYEPILATLPDEDKIGQIQKMNEELSATFGEPPKGAWLAERVWEPHLPRALAQAGVRYTILDDTHFEATGFDRERDMFGYYITEDQNDAIAVFPTLTRLRYMIPWGTTTELIDWLRDQAEQPLPSNQPKVALMSDDGEKFGTWPGTYEHCWGENKYMVALFEALTKESSWLKTCTPSEYLAQFPALGRAYLPSASYMEMGVWSLPAEAAYQYDRLRQALDAASRLDLTRYMRGGLWRNFMVKYDEVNHLHKRMMMVSRAVHQMRRGRKRDRALDLLWAAQGNDPYWHGLFGGIYLFNARVANYANLLAAEDIAQDDEAPLIFLQQDIDRDSHVELIMLGNPLTAIWKPSLGGAMVEFDYRPAYYNLLNVMMRRHEAYHAELTEAAADRTLITPESSLPEPENANTRVVRAKESGLENLLIYDWHRRGSFIDHFLAPATSLREFYRAQYAEQGDFINQPYEVIRSEQTATTLTFQLERTGHVWIGEAHRVVTVRKTVAMRLGEATLSVNYVLSNDNEVPIELRFGIETVIGFDGGQDPRYTALRINDLPERFPLANLREFESISRHATDSSLRNLTLRTELTRPAFLWQFPLETITLSEAGFERGYQGTVLLHWWTLHLAPHETWQVQLVQTVQTSATRG